MGNNSPEVWLHSIKLLSMKRLLKSNKNLFVIMVSSDLIDSFLNSVPHRIKIILILALLRIILCILFLNKINVLDLILFVLSLSLTRNWLSIRIIDLNLIYSLA